MISKIKQFFINLLTNRSATQGTTISEQTKKVVKKPVLTYNNVVKPVDVPGRSVSLTLAVEFHMTLNESADYDVCVNNIMLMSGDEFSKAYIDQASPELIRDNMVGLLGVAQTRALEDETAKYEKMVLKGNDLHEEVVPFANDIDRSKMN